MDGNNNGNVPAWMLGVGGKKGKAMPTWMQYYGDNTVRLNGQTRSTPLRQRQMNPLQGLLDELLGRGRPPGGGMADVRG